MTRACSWCGDEFQTEEPKRKKCDRCRSRVAYDGDFLPFKRKHLITTSRAPRYRASHTART